MRLLPLLALAILFPSCAYVQTHKNVEERGRSYPGYQLEKPRQLYRSGSTWYVAAAPAEFRLQHDSIHDKVFRQSNAPVMTLLHTTSDSPAFHPISPHTATVLLRSDGYADTASLARELSGNPAAWSASLPQASVHAVKALVEGDAPHAITGEPTPAKLPLGYQILSGLDFAFVDVPGTIVYNIAVPVMIPFVFFYEFLSYDNQ